jgi:hypothetical protein
VVAVKLALARMLPGPWLFSDSTLYARQAAAILRHGLLVLREGVQDYTILYPLFLAPAFLLDSRAEAHQAALVLNALASSSTVFPIYWIARRMLPRAVSVLLTAVTAFLPSLFVYALALSSENLFFPLFWWATFFLMRLSEDDRSADALAAGLAIGLLPAVKLTGFAILAAAAVVAVGMSAFHKIHGRRAALLLVAVVLPQLAWVAARALLGTAERGLFGFGPGVGESLVASLAGFNTQTWRTFFGYFLGETTYFLVGAYVAWICFSVYLIWQYRTWRARSREGFLLLWTFLSAAALVLVTLVFLFPIAQTLTDPEQRAREIYGRFIEVLFPAFFILGTRGMLDFAAKGASNAPRAPSAEAWHEVGVATPSRAAAARTTWRELSLLLLVVVFTAISFYPLTGYAISSPYRDFALAWLVERLGIRFELLLAALLAAAVTSLALLALRGERARRAAFGLALLSVLGFHALAFAVTLVGVIGVARVRDVTLYQIGHWLGERADASTRVSYDERLGYDNQYFAYRFWSDADWQVVAPEELLRSGPDFIVTDRPMPGSPLVEEANGVRLYAGEP